MKIARNSSVYLYPDIGTYPSIDEHMCGNMTPGPGVGYWREGRLRSKFLVAHKVVSKFSFSLCYGDDKFYLKPSVFPVEREATKFSETSFISLFVQNFEILL